MERFVRQPDDSWLLREVTELEGVLELESVGITIPLSEIYRGVESSDPDAPSGE